MSVAQTIPRPFADVYDAAYTGNPNWDIGRPQRVFVELVEAELVRGPVLDVGCGTGELSLFLARHGYDVLGIDLSEVAIERARQKARWCGIDVHFLVWDALNLPSLAAAEFSFLTVVDSATFHLLGHRERDWFIGGLPSVVARGGRYCVLGDVPSGNRPGYGITPNELRRRFDAAGGWLVEFAIRTVFERRWSTNPAHFIGTRRQ